MKQKRYWLRGGVIGIFFPFIAYIFGLLFYSFFNIDLTYIFFRPITDIFVFLFHTNDVWNSYTGGLIAPGTGIFILYTTITYIFLGVFLGWLYGKLKNNHAQP